MLTRLSAHYIIILSFSCYNRKCVMWIYLLFGAHVHVCIYVPYVYVHKNVCNKKFFHSVNKIISPIKINNVYHVQRHFLDTRLYQLGFNWLVNDWHLKSLSLDLSTSSSSSLSSSPMLISSVSIMSTKSDKARHLCVLKWRSFENFFLHLLQVSLPSASTMEDTQDIINSGPPHRRKVWENAFCLARVLTTSQPYAQGATIYMEMRLSNKISYWHG